MFQIETSENLSLPALIAESMQLPIDFHLSEVEPDNLVMVEGSCVEAGISSTIRLTSDVNAADVSRTILTPGLFPIMELPPEIRVKILDHLLTSANETIIIDSGDNGACILKEGEEFEFDHPSVAILQTCKRINEEGNPILYGRNNFTVCLPLEHKHNPRQNSAFFLRPMRWSTIACINTMNFISKSPAIVHGNPSDPDTYRRPQAVFTCTAAHLLSRFTISDFKYSPQGPDEYVVLSMSNHVSTQVMRAELSAFQRELEEMMRPSEEYLTAMADDPAT